jgi:hypothetical protein
MTLFHWLTRCFCLHTDAMVKREDGRMCMVCPQCGHESRDGCWTTQPHE